MKIVLSLLLCLAMFAFAPAKSGGPADWGCGQITLDVSSPMIGGQPVLLEMSGADPGEPLLLFVSPFSNPVPFGPCTLVPDLSVVLEFYLVADGAGEVSVVSTFPSGVPPGTVFHMQALAEDVVGYEVSEYAAPVSG